jgi:hypothetical protein
MTTRQAKQSDRKTRSTEVVQVLIKKKTRKKRQRNVLIRKHTKSNAPTEIEEKDAMYNFANETGTTKRESNILIRKEKQGGAA